MKRRELSPHEKAAALELRRLWDVQKGPLGLTQERVAFQFGWKQQSAVSQYLNGVIPLNLEALVKFSDLLRAPAEEIFPDLARKLPRGATVESLGISLTSDVVYVSKVTGAKLAGGRGEIIHDFEEVDKSHSFRREWMAQAGLSPDKCKLWDVTGDSMSPTLNHGDSVMIHTAEREVVSGKVYALIAEDGMRVKRLIRRADGIVVMHSDNPMQHLYPPEPILSETVAIYGRVVWKAGKL
ncbi:LexA family transcriptional regulator [Solimonas sp. K1W22B-7]|uniref:LexA family transcriptional regulator n=1 Tax=Solimonas sp. K1W22B-7 TaxID=2303331 RepID=UPI0013C4FB54|nr:S24 family peptidase [Solimonas sp. K1W22B-7]